MREMTLQVIYFSGNISKSRLTNLSKVMMVFVGSFVKGVGGLGMGHPVHRLSGIDQPDSR